MVTGSCLCGAVRYQATAPLGEMHHCHCSMCRKGHGAAFSTYARSEAGAFRFTAGESLVKQYRSSAPITRSFCSECGANLLFRFEGMPEAVWIAAGTIDGDPGVRPSAHIFADSKACWFDITDDLQRFPQYPPF
ncbi:MAG TPA: GFA family protein [Terriglobales bacterium]|nr:GFA family protein [Terriglobales bacterium]